MQKTAFRKLVLSTTACLAIAATPASVSAQQSQQKLEQVIQSARETNQLAQASQEKIDSLASQTQQALAEYKQVIKQLEDARAYNARLERVINNQEQEKARIQRAIDGAQEVQRGVGPHMEDMLDRVEQFIRADIPFRLEDRLARLDRAREILDASDVDEPEKYRQVLSIYETEVDYGRTIEAFEGVVETASGEIDVEFLRIGRVGYYYRTKDGSQAAAWDETASGDNKWVSLSGGQAQAIGRGILIATQNATPDIVRLPVPAPEQSQ